MRHHIILLQHNWSYGSADKRDTTLWWEKKENLNNAHQDCFNTAPNWNDNNKILYIFLLPKSVTINTKANFRTQYYQKEHHSLSHILKWLLVDTSYSALIQIKFINSKDIFGDLLCLTRKATLNSSMRKPPWSCCNFTDIWHLLTAVA